jgi:hypothetical protein
MVVIVSDVTCVYRNFNKILKYQELFWYWDILIGSSTPQINSSENKLKAFRVERKTIKYLIYFTLIIVFV